VKQNQPRKRFFPSKEGLSDPTPPIISDHHQLWERPLPDPSGKPPNTFLQARRNSVLPIKRDQFLPGPSTSLGGKFYGWI